MTVELCTSPCPFRRTMPIDDIPSRIEHTVLGPETTPGEVIDELDAAIEYGMAARVPPCYLSLANSYAPGIELTTVVGYPDGQHAPAVKAAEAERASADGADELDVVCNLGRLRASEDDGVAEDLAEVVAATARPVNAIVPVSRLRDAELDRLCRLAVDAGVDTLKLLAGDDGGPSAETVASLGRYLPVTAGGVDSWETARSLLEAGATRIGTARGDVIVEEYRRSKA